MVTGLHRFLQHFKIKQSQTMVTGFKFCPDHPNQSPMRQLRAYFHCEHGHIRLPVKSESVFASIVCAHANYSQCNLRLLFGALLPCRKMCWSDRVKLACDFNQVYSFQTVSKDVFPETIWRVRLTMMNIFSLLKMNFCNVFYLLDSDLNYIYLILKTLETFAYVIKPNFAEIP